MKKIIISIVAVSMLISAGANARVSSDSEKSINVRVSPSMLYGVFNGKVDVKVKKNIAIGGMFDRSVLLLKYYSFGAGLHIKLDGEDIMSSDGWLINPYATYAYGKFKEHQKGVKDASNKTIAVLLGHQWVWESGYNFRIGFGVQHNSIEVFERRTWPDFTMTFGCVF